MTKPNSWADLFTNGRGNGYRSGLGALPPGLPHLTDNQFKEFMRAQEGVVANALMARQEFFKQFLDPRRSIDDECGYPSSQDTSSFGAEAYKALYDRHPIAARVCEVMPQECWQVSPIVFEDEDPDVVTPFEEAWDALGQQLRGEASWYQDEEGSPVYDELRRADILSGIGHFGVILLGFDDGRNLQDPVDGVLTMNDAYATENEEKTLNELQDGYRETRFGVTKDKPEGVYTLKVPTYALNSQEKLVVNDWTKERECYVTNRVPVGAKPPASGHGSVGQAPPMQAPSAFGSTGFGLGLGYLGGTDQQYFGVQFGPSEIPSDEPAQTSDDKPRMKLLFMRSFDESLVQIVRYEWNIRNPRFGQPVMYRITLNDPREQHSGIGLPLATVFVHWSRVIHITDGYNQAGNSKIFSAPRMRCVLNRLLDLAKLYGGGAEGYWRSCFAGLAISTHPQLGGDVDIDTPAARDSMENYFNGLQRYLLLSGASANTLAPSVVDPSGQIEKQIEAICIKIPCPVRVFKGSERGELASTQDDDKWLDVLRGRNNSYTTPRIIVPFVDRLILVGVLPEPGMGKKKQQEQVENADYRKRMPGGWLVANAVRMTKEEDEDGEEEENDNNDMKTEFLPDGGYSVEWPPLDALGAKDKAAICLQNTQAAAAYAQGVEAIIPPKEWLTSKKFMDMDEEEAHSMLESAAKAHETDMDGTMTMPPAGGPGGVAKPPPPPPTPIIAGKAGVPPGVPGAPPAGIPAQPPDKQQAKIAVTAKAQAKPPTSNDDWSNAID